MGKYTQPTNPTEGFTRDVDHCAQSEYVKPVTIKIAEPAHNSDNLDRLEFEEVAYEALSQRGLYKPGDKVMWIPGDSILPTELSDLLGVTGYLDRGRVKTIRLRGNRSEGLTGPIEMIEPFLPKILKYESKPIFRNSICGVPGSKAKLFSRFNAPPAVISKFYKMPNLLNAPYTFKEGDEIQITEKIHGSNARLGHLKRPSMGLFFDIIFKLLFWITGYKMFDKYQYYVGSHNRMLNRVDPSLYGKFNKTFDKYLKNKIPKGYVFYGELYGPGIQKGFDYGLDDLHIRLFSAKHESDGEYIPRAELEELCAKHDLPIAVKDCTVKYENIEQLRKYSEMPSNYTDKHIREGIVCTLAENGHRIAKLISFEYLKIKDRTEHH